MGFFYSTAIAYQKYLEEHGFKVEVRSMDNSLDIVDRVNNVDSDVDIGFLAQSIDVEKYPNTRTLGAVELEPLFVFYQKNLGHLNGIADLRGKKISFGSTQSGTRQIVEEILPRFGVSESDTHFASMNLIDTEDALINGKIDAGFFLLPMYQPIIKRLAANKNLSLMNIEQSDAIVHELGGNRAMRTVKIPQGIYDLEALMPSAELTLPAEFVTVIIKKSASASVAHSLLKAMDFVHGKKVALYGDRGYFPTPGESALSLHPSAEVFYAKGFLRSGRYLPSWMSDAAFNLVVMLVPLLVILGPLRSLLGAPKPHVAVQHIRRRIWLAELEIMYEATRSGRSLSPRQKERLSRIKRMLHGRRSVDRKCGILIERMMG